MRRLVLVALSGLLAVMLGGCMDPKRDPTQSLAGVPRIYPVVQQYYEARATEENGRCRAPLLEGVLTARVVEEDDAKTVIQMRYLYRDLTADLRGGCRGFGNRTVTVSKGPEVQVIEMTGPQHPSGLRLRLAGQ